MSSSDEKSEYFSTLIAIVQSRLETGEADRAFAVYEQRVTDRVAKLQKAEELDPQTLKLTVTI
jgi:hypothetical protein